MVRDTPSWGAKSISAAIQHLEEEVIVKRASIPIDRRRSAVRLLRFKLLMSDLTTSQIEDDSN
jgi:hypothetical protein